MKTYKLIFVRNNIVTCQMVNDKANMNGNYYYEHDRGHLIYAIVKADNELNAYNVGKQIVREVSDTVLGTDYAS